MRVCFKVENVVYHNIEINLNTSDNLPKTCPFTIIWTSVLANLHESMKSEIFLLLTNVGIPFFDRKTVET